MSLPSLPLVDMSFNMSSNPNLLSTFGDDTSDFGVHGNHFNQSLSNPINHQPIFSSNNQMINIFNNHPPQDPNSIGSRLISSNHMNYDYVNHGTYGNMLTCVKQEPNMVLSSCFSPSSSSSSPSSFICSQNSRSLPSLGSNNQFELGKRMAQQMRRHLIPVSPPRTQVSSFIDYSPIKNNPHMTRVSITETVTKQLSMVIPANTLVSVQNDIERVKRALACDTNIHHSPSNHVSLSQNVIGEQSIDHEHAEHTEILSVKPLSIIFPRVINQNPYLWHHRENNLDNPFSKSLKDEVYPEYLNVSPSLGRHNNPSSSSEFQPKPNQGKRSRRPKKVNGVTEYFANCSEEEGESEDDGYDGRTHSLPYEKYGPYTCPKCNNVFDTSQKFAAHMVSVHYRNETSKEKRKRLRARYKKQIRLLDPEILGVKLDASEQLGAPKELEKVNSEDDEKEERIEKEDGESSKGTNNGDGVLHDVVVKQELV